MQEFQSLADLLDLQDIDLQIDRLLHRRSNLPELEQYRAAHEQVTAAERTVNDLDTQLTEANRALDKAEGELELSEIKIGEQEQRLFAGGMSAKETENMRLDIESQKRRKGDMEDTVLTLLDQREALEESLKAARAELDVHAANKAELEAKVGAEWKTIDAEVARKEERKKAAVQLIPGDLLETYEKLRQTKEGVAVGRLADGVCGGCHLTLSAAEQIEVLKDDPPRCLHCRRLLVP